MAGRQFGGHYLVAARETRPTAPVSSLKSVRMMMARRDKEQEAPDVSCTGRAA